MVGQGYLDGHGEARGNVPTKRNTDSRADGSPHACDIISITPSPVCCWIVIRPTKQVSDFHVFLLYMPLQTDHRYSRGRGSPEQHDTGRNPRGKYGHSRQQLKVSSHPQLVGG